MTKDNTIGRVEILERQLAELMTLPVIMDSRKTAETERRRVESAEIEAAKVAAKKSAEAEQLLAHVTADPLTRVSMKSAEPGDHFICDLVFASGPDGPHINRRLRDSSRLAIAVDGAPINGTWHPHSWTGRKSDLAEMAAASNSELPRAIAKGLLVVHEYDPATVVADAKLRRAWFNSRPRP